MTRINRKQLAIAGALAALTSGGAGVAAAVGGSDEKVRGPDAEAARAAALAAVPGTVTGIEHQDGDGPGAFEVEIERADGTEVEVHVDGDYSVLGSAADDDQVGEDDDADGQAGS